VTTHIAHLEVRNLHRRMSIAIDFDRDINVLFGKNGTGKTTLLHILANILNGSIERFAYLEFDRIMIVTSDERHIELYRLANEKMGGSTIRLMLNGESIAAVEVGNGHRRSLQERPEQSHDRILRGKQLRDRLGMKQAAYFPAFRTMIEAWRSIDLDSHAALSRLGMPSTRFPRPRSQTSMTSFARSLFGDFVPALNYPSLLDIEQDLSREVELTTFAVAKESQNVLTSAFVDAFRAVLSTDSTQPPRQTTVVLEDIGKLLQESDHGSEDIAEQDDVYGQFRRILSSMQVNQVADNSAAVSVLSIYRQALKEQNEVRQQTYAAVDRYVASVNEFLEEKQLEVSRGQRKDARDITRVAVRLANGDKTRLRSLSSGERQIVSMLYAASPSLSSSSSIMGGSDVVLIDEPEISLHIDWQRDLLPKMQRLVGGRQIIVCTHSPEIGADYENKYREVLYQWTGGNPSSNGHSHGSIDKAEDEDLELDESEL